MSHCSCYGGGAYGHAVDCLARTPEVRARELEMGIDRRCECGCGLSLNGQRPSTKYATRKCRRSVAKARNELRRSATLEEAEMVAIVERDPCAYCGHTREHHRDHVGADHIVPVSKGGELDWTNVTGCCGFCNSSKHDKPLLYFLAVYVRPRMEMAR